MESRGTARRANIAIIVSLLSLAAQIVMYLYTHKQNDRAIAGVQRQIDAAGPSLAFSFSTSYDLPNELPSPPDTTNPTHLSRGELLNYSQVWLKAVVIDRGRIPTTVDTVSLQIAPHFFIQPGKTTGADVYCERLGSSFTPCSKSLPLKMEVGEKYQFWFPLRDYSDRFEMKGLPASGCQLSVSATGTTVDPTVVGTGFTMGG